MTTEYAVCQYQGTLPGDAGALRDFVIQPASPWFSLAERRIVNLSLSPGNPFRDLWVVVRDGERIVAAAWGCWSNDTDHTGVLGFVLTDPQYRNQGLAARVCREVLNYAQALGCRCMILGTGNARAARIYEKLGFRLWYGSHYIWPQHADGGIAAMPARQWRQAQWADLPLLVRLILAGHEQHLIDPFEKLTRRNGLLEQPRTVSTGASLLLRSEKTNHVLWVCQNSNRQISGTACMVMEGPENQVFFQLHLDSQAPIQQNELWKLLIKYCNSLEIKQLKSFCRSEDRFVLRVLQDFDFQLEIIHDGDITLSLLVD